MSTVKMSNLLNFIIKENYVLLDKNKKVYFIKFSPPNLSIMTDNQIASEIEKMTELFDNLRCTISLFITDKVEDLRTQKLFYQNLSNEFEVMKADIIKSLESREEKNLAIQRAYYFVVQEKQSGDIDNILNVFHYRGFRVELAQRKELIALVRNYYAKEFEITDVYTIEQAIKDSSNKEMKNAVLEKEITKRIIPLQMDFLITQIRHNNIYRKVMMVKNLPESPLPTTLLKVARLKGVTLNLRYTPMTGRETKKLIDQQQNVQKGKESTNKQTDADDAIRAQKLMQNFYRTISSKGSAVYLTNIYIEIYATSQKKLDELENSVISNLDTGVTLEYLLYNQKKGFNSVNPLGRDLFGAVANNLPSVTAAALYPCSHSALTHDHGMALGSTVDHGSFMPDLNYRDETITSGNTVITGAPGLGKTYLQRKIINFSYMSGDTVFIFDPENEYVDQVRQLKGTVINCANGIIKINPFEMRPIFSDDDFDMLDKIDKIEDKAKRDDVLENYKFAKNRAVFFQHISWLTDFFQLIYPTIDILLLKKLMKIVQKTYIKHGILETTDISNCAPTDYITFTELYNNIETAENIEEYGLQSMKDLKLLIEDCYDGTLSILLNGTTNLPQARLVCFALAELLEGSRERLKAVLFNLTSYVWGIVMLRKFKVLMLLDELYLFLQEIIMAKYLKSYIKRDRKYDAKLCITTQQVADCLRGEAKDYATAIFDNSPFKFLFYPGDVDLHVVKEVLHLTDGEYNKIVTPRKKHCLAKIGSSSYYVEVGSFPFEELLFGTRSGK